MSIAIEPELAPRRIAAVPAAVAYVLMVAGAVAFFFFIRGLGESLVAPEMPVGTLAMTAARGGDVDVAAHTLTTLAAIVGLGFALGRLFRYVGQPPVIGEVVGGILLGPSLLGAISPAAMHALIPDTAADPHGRVVAALGAIAQLGVVLYMFLVGLDLNGAKLRRRARSTVAISHASIVAPFVLGIALAHWLYPILSHRGVPFTSFALFMGAALSVTAFPVMARILADRRMERTEVGQVAMGCAAAGDVTAWCLLSLVVGVAQSQLAGAAMTAVSSLAFTAGMFLAVRPLVERLCRWMDNHENVESLAAMAIPLAFVALLIAALITHWLGVHAVFGAFLLGVVIPHDSRLAHECTRRLKDVVTVLLLPAFFALTGLRTEIGLLDSGQQWLICAAITAIATLGKFGGTFIAAWTAGHDSRSSAALGVLMNTRGLMGLIVLDIGLEIGVITPTLFAMMVIMALATTMLAAPVLNRLKL